MTFYQSIGVVSLVSVSMFIFFIQLRIARKLNNLNRSIAATFAMITAVPLCFLPLFNKSIDAYTLTLGCALLLVYYSYAYLFKKLNVNKMSFEEASEIELIDPVSTLPKPITLVLFMVRMFILIGYFLYIVSPQGSWASWFGLVLLFVLLEAVLFYVIKQFFPKYDFVKYQWKIDLEL